MSFLGLAWLLACYLISVLTRWHRLLAATRHIRTNTWHSFVDCELFSLLLSTGHLANKLY